MMAGKRTMRRTTRTYNRIPVDLEFSDVERYSLKHDDGSREVAVSTVDLLLEDCDAFILSTISNRFCYGSNCRNGNLNKHGMWESILNELENTCISKTTRSHKYNKKCETVYTVPVVGHKVFFPPATDDDFELGMYHELRQNVGDDHNDSKKLTKSAMKKIKRNPSQFLFWEGKYYDANKVYIFKPELSNYLKPIGDNVAPRAEILTAHIATSSTTNDSTSAAAGTTSKHQPTVEFVKNISFHNAQHQRVHQACRIIHEGQSLGTNYNNVYSGVRMGYWEQLNTSDYLEINLGYPRCVTHIGTAGEFPQTSVFPSRATVGRTRLRRFRAEGESLETHLLSQNGNGVKVRKFAPHVRILKEDEHTLSWVTSYEVHYRHTVTNKWTLIAVVPANSDAFSEHLLDLSPYFNAKDGVFTQYLRIRPMDFHNKPRMRLSVYGIDTIVSTQEGEKGIVTAGQHNSCGTEDVPTITYAITDSSSQSAVNYVRDGLRAYYYVDDWHYNLLHKARALKRQDFRKMMVQQTKTGDL